MVEFRSSFCSRVRSLHRQSGFRFYLLISRFVFAGSLEDKIMHKRASSQPIPSFFFPNSLCVFFADFYLEVRVFACGASFHLPFTAEMFAPFFTRQARGSFSNKFSLMSLCSFFLLPSFLVLFCSFSIVVCPWCVRTLFSLPLVWLSSLRGKMTLVSGVRVLGGFSVGAGSLLLPA